MFYELKDYELNIFFQDGAYVATTLEIPTVSGIGDSHEEALKELEEVFELAKKSYVDDGKPMPEPLSLHNYSGQFRLRIPISTHRKLAERAILEKTSLNQLAVAFISEGLERRNCYHDKPDAMSA